MIRFNIMEYNTIQYNKIQHNTIQYNVKQYNAIRSDGTIQHNTLSYNTILYIYKQNKIRHNPIQYDTMQCNTVTVSQPYLCDVRMSVLADCLTLDSVSHNSLLARGSMPEDGSSKNIIEGSPTRATAVLSFRLLPPLQNQMGNKI